MKPNPQKKADKHLDALLFLATPYFFLYTSFFFAPEPFVDFWLLSTYGLVLLAFTKFCHICAGVLIFRIVSSTMDAKKREQFLHFPLLLLALINILIIMGSPLASLLILA